MAGKAAALPPPVPVSQFDMTGYLQAATLGGADVLAGGTLTVNGQLVVVPRNLIVIFPAGIFSWEQMFQLAPPPYGPTQTGMAMSDVPAPFIPYEVQVIGNRVAVAGQPDQYIAGMAFIHQSGLNQGQGYINFIDYSVGEMRVGGIIGDPTTGQRIRINDPTGRFNGTLDGKTPLPTRLSPDVRFTLDPENPTVKSETAYPMCLPSNAAGDPLCPLSNRPIDPLTGAFVTQIHMPPPAAPAVLGGPVCSGTAVGLDPCLAAPFEVGDYITYAGELVKDGPQPSVGPNPTITPVNTSYISVWNIAANVGIWTSPGTNPAYVATDVLLMGTGGVSALGAAEATIRTRFEGFATDPTFLPPADPTCSDPAFKKTLGQRCSVVDVYAYDVDPCSGTVSDRPWGGIDVDPGPPTGVKPGRWRFRPPSRLLPLAGASGVFDPPPQQMRSRLRGATPTLTKNGVLAGQYITPITEYIFPENGVTGTAIVPNNFESVPFLVNGLGPLFPGGPLVGQLTPWPGGGTFVAGTPAPPTPVNCAVAVKTAPTANAGPNQSVPSGALITLDASASTDPNGLTLTYAWTQTAGPVVTLSSPTAMFPTFTAPTLLATDPAVVFTFSLTVTDSAGLVSAPASVTITVNPPVAITAPIANAGLAQTVASGASVGLNGSGSTDPNVPVQPLSFLWTAPAGVTLNSATAANPTFVAPINPGPAPLVLTFSLTVTNTSLLSSTATVAITVNPAVAPIANPGPNQTVLSGTLVTLNGIASFDPNGLPLSFAFTQVSGPAVTLSPGATASAVTFTAPTATVSPITLGFTLTVSDSVPLSSAPALVTVTVTPTVDTVTILTAVYRITKQRLTVTAQSSVPTAQLFLLDPTKPAPASCNVSPLPTACLPMTLGVGGVPTVILVGVPDPGVANLTVVSSLGGSASSPLTRIR